MEHETLFHRHDQSSDIHIYIMYSTRSRSTFISLWLFIIGCCIIAPSEARSQEDRPGSTRLFITYRCAATDRPTFLSALAGDQVRQLDEWKRAGVFSDYLLLFNHVVDENTWDAMVMLTFDRYAQTAKWREIERTRPGGLSSDLLKLAKPTTSYLADLVISNGTSGDHSKSIFVVIPYTYRVKGEYLTYIQTFGIPQFDGWIREGAISNYGIFFNQHATGKPWDVLLLFEYNGIDGLARRDIVKQKVRGELVKNPGWKFAQDAKADIRVEHEVVIADPVTAASRGR
jgi:hypothetical protein